MCKLDEVNDVFGVKHKCRSSRYIIYHTIHGSYGYCCRKWSLIDGKDKFKVEIQRLVDYLNNSTSLLSWGITTSQRSENPEASSSNGCFTF